MSTEADDIGVPLRHYIEKHPRVGVRFICQGCCQTTVHPRADVLAGLKTSAWAMKQRVSALWRDC